MKLVCIGSNISPERYVPMAIDALRLLGGVRHSSIIETAALDRPEQDNYWNGLVELETEMSREEIEAALHAIEDAAGRRRTPDKYAARTLDLDLVAWDDWIDPEVAQREFLAACLAELHGEPLGNWPVVMPQS